MSDTPKTEEIETAVIEESSELQKMASAEPVNQEFDIDALPASTQMIVQDDLIAKLASDPNVDVDKMQAIIDMKIQVMEYQANVEATRAYNIDWVAFRQELGPVIKNRTNDHTKSMYADLDAVKKVIDPILAKHGFCDRYKDETLENGKLKITCVIVHKGGHSEFNSVELPVDDKGPQGKVNKTPIHGTLSAMTTGQRVTLCRACGIRIAEDDDGNAAGNTPISAEEMETVREYLELTGSQEDKFCEAFKIERLANLNQEQLKTAMIQLKTKVKRQEKEQAKQAAEKAAAEKTRPSCAKCDDKGFVDEGDTREPCTACNGKAVS